MRNFGQSLLQITNKFKRQVEKKLMLFDLSDIQGRMLVFIYEESKNKDVFQRDIELEFELRASTVTAILNNLEKKGYLSRVSSNNDQRLKKIVLTSKALDSIKAIREILDEIEEETFKNLSQTEIKALNVIISKIDKNTMEY